MPAISYLQPDQAYRSDPAHAQSYVKHILRSPAHYKASLKRKFAPTPFMQMGSALHCLVLEGEEQFERDCILKPEGLSLTTKEGKEWKEANKKKIILSNSDQYQSWDAVHGMAASLRELDWFNSKAKDYRKFNELSLYWEQDKLDCKCRIDRLVFEDDCANILDLKTTDEVEFDKFVSKVLSDINYLFQAGWYVEGVHANFNMPAKFTFIGVERKPPYVARIFEVGGSMLEEAFRQTTYARQTLAECIAKNEWPRPKVTNEVLELPPWYRSPVPSAMIDADDSSLDYLFGTPQ
jgi:hypothetical protein